MTPRSAISSSITSSGAPTQMEHFSLAGTRLGHTGARGRNLDWKTIEARLGFIPLPKACYQTSTSTTRSSCASTKKIPRCTGTSLHRRPNCSTSNSLSAMTAQIAKAIPRLPRYSETGSLSCYQTKSSLIPLAMDLMPWSEKALCPG